MTTRTDPGTRVERHYAEARRYAGYLADETNPGVARIFRRKLGGHLAAITRIGRLELGAGPDYRAHL